MKDHKIIDIDYFKEFNINKLDEKYVNYIDDDVVVIQNIENLSDEKDEMMRLNLFMIVVCLEGEIKLCINRKEYQIQSEEVLICLPTMLISSVVFSPQYKVGLIGFSNAFVQQAVRQKNTAWKTLYYCYNNPILGKLTEEKTVDSYKFSLYYQLVLDKINNSLCCYQQVILRTLFSAIFYEMLDSIKKYADELGKTENEISNYRRIFSMFMEELAMDGGLHRSVSYFANRMCYTAKYISTAIKDVSGRTPLEWINDYVIEQIRHELEHSNKSIKEIAIMFDFPNQSFFSKYVRVHLGISPASYRSSLSMKK